MPRVQNQQFGFAGKTVQRVINVDNKGRFTAKLPDFAHKLLNYSEVGGQTLEECERNWKKASKEFEMMQTRKRKVICYEVKATAYVIDKALNRVTMSEDGIHFCEGVAVAVVAEIYEESRLTKGDGSISYSYEPVENNLPSSISHRARFHSHYGPHPIENCMDWTPQREEFFARIAMGIEAVILQLRQLNNVQNALAFADSGKLALLEKT